MPQVSCVGKKFARTARVLLAVAALSLACLLGQPDFCAASDDEGVYKILCVGDSYVWGIGGRRFPDWLEEALRKKYPGLKFSVSSAWSGPDSVSLLKNLPNFLDQSRPSVLILLSGEANAWKDMAALRMAGPPAVRRIPVTAADGASSCDLERFPESYGNLPSRKLKPWFEFDDLPEDSVCSGAKLPKTARALVLADLQLLQSSLFLKMGAAGKAAERAECACGLAPSSARAQAVAANAFASQLYCSQALEAAQRAATISSAYGWQSESVQGFCSSALGDYKSAAEFYAQALGKTKSQPSLYYGLCSALAEKSDFAGAVKACADGLAVFPSDERILEGYIRAQALSGSYGAAFDLLLRSDKADEAARERCYDAFYGTLLSAGEYDKAEKYATRHAAGLKRPWLPKMFMARFYAVDRNFSAEAALLKELRWQYPAVPELLLLDGDAAQRRCDYEQAEQLYARAVALSPGSWGGYFALGELFSRQGDISSALAYLEQARALAPSEPRVYLQLGRALWQKRDLSGAIANYKRTLLLSPRMPDAFRELAASLLESGQGASAALELSAELPGLLANTEYQAFLRNRRPDSAEDTAWYGALQDSLEQDMVSACRLAQKKGARTVFSSYPDRELPGVASAARECKAVYVDFAALFKNRYKTRRDYISYDNRHPNSSGYRFMSEEYARVIGGMLRLDETLSEDFD